MNKVILIGHVGKDPEIRYMNNGEAAASLSLATNKSFKDKESGEKKTLTEWHRISAFGPKAELIEKYVHKGDRLCVEGELRTRKWQDRDGNDRYTTEVVCRDLEFLSSRSESSEGRREPRGEAQREHRGETQRQPRGETYRDPTDRPVATDNGDFPDDDIPF